MDDSKSFDAGPKGTETAGWGEVKCRFVKFKTAAQIRQLASQKGYNLQ